MYKTTRLGRCRGLRERTRKCMTAVQNLPVEIHLFHRLAKHSMVYGSGNCSPLCCLHWGVAATQNSSKWSNCRISWSWAGTKDIEFDGPNNLKVGFDEIKPTDNIQKITTYRTSKFLRGLSMLYSSGTEVKHGNCGSDSVDSFKTDPDEYIIDSSVHGSKKAQFTAPAVVDGLRLVSINA